MLIVFEDMIADMLTNIKIYPIVTELFIRGSKLNMLLLPSVILLFQKILD